MERHIWLVRCKSLPLKLLSKSYYSSKQNLVIPSNSIFSACYSTKKSNPTSDSCSTDSKSWNLWLNRCFQDILRESTTENECLMSKTDQIHHRSYQKTEKIRAFSRILRICGQGGYFNEGKAVHCQMIKKGLYLWNSLELFYVKCGDLDSAVEVFDEMPKQDVVAWSVILSGFVTEGHGRDGIKIYCEMKKDGCARPNEFIMTSALKACSLCLDRDFGVQLHAEVMKMGMLSDVYVGSTLVGLYAKCGDIEFADTVFFSMPKKNVVSWNVLLYSYAKMVDKVQGIFKEMLVESFKPDVDTFLSILKSCSTHMDLGFGEQVHVCVIKYGLEGNLSVGTALVGIYAKSRRLEDAILIFDGLMEKDLLVWTVILAAYAQANQFHKSFKCFRKMLQKDFQPNHFTLSCILSSCTTLAALDSGRQLHSLAIRYGLSDNMHVSCALLNMYVKCGSMVDSEIVFRGMKSRNVVSWNTIICGYARYGWGLDALEAFKQMLDEGIKPDEITFIGVLSACSYLGLVEEGKMYFDLLSTVYGIYPTVEHCACMVNILCRAGRFVEAETFIEEKMLTENAFIWETIMWACKLHGNAKLCQRASKKVFELEPEKDYNYITLSDTFASMGRWRDVSNVRDLMRKQGIRKEPGCSRLEVDSQNYVFYAHDQSQLQFKEIYSQLEAMAY